MYGKRDENQTDIVDALRSVGATVLDLADVGRNCPDILAGYKGVNYLMEIKTATGKLTPGQAEFIKEWRGLSVAVVRTVDEAYRVIGLEYK